MNDKPVCPEKTTAAAKPRKGIDKVLAKGLVIKNPYIDRILAGTRAGYLGTCNDWNGL